MSALNAVLDGKLQGDVQLADNSVHVERLVPRMVVFVVRAGNIHSALFNKPLVLTSGNDGEHMERSAHYRNAAVDMRSRDVTPVQQQLFTLVLVDLGLEEGVVVFDERANPAKQHWHCEVA